MESLINSLNAAGSTFVNFASSMLIQSSILIVALVILDFVLRKRVRAVFRYWIWMLVLVKLVLPTSMASPVSPGYWLSLNIGQKQTETEPGTTSPAPSAIADQSASSDITPESFLPVADDSTAALPYKPLRTEAENAETLTNKIPLSEIKDTKSAPAATLEWEAMLFLGWLGAVLAMALLLIQRISFVQGLLAQSAPPSQRMQNTLRQSCRKVGLRKTPNLRLSPISASPSVSGLLRPTILIPRNLAEKITNPQLESIILHELVHIKRADLWVSFLQTLIQIFYFYNLLLWLANAIIRKVREQAVDEATLVAMGENAEQYPETLLHISRLTFSRPALSLRLIGVVESKKALTARIKHILSRPFPKSAKLGLLGLLAIIITAATLLPMAAAKEKPETTIPDKPHTFKATLPNGVTVELLGICEHPSEGKQWWRPDGTLLEKAPYQTMGGSLTHDEGYSDYEFVLRVESSGDASFDVQVPGGRHGTYTGTPYDQEGNRVEDLRVYTANQPEDKDSTLVRIGATADKWQTRAVYKPDDKEKTYDFDSQSIGFNRPYEYHGDIILPCTHNFNKPAVQVDIRVVAVKKDGSIWLGSCSGSGGNVLHTWTYRFESLPLEEIKQFEFQTRTYQWLTFKNVSLKPGQKTDVKIEVEKAASDNSATDSKRHQNISFHEGIPLREALRLLGKAHNKNIIPSEKVVGTVPVTELYNVTLEEALQAILGTHKYVIDGNFIRVYTRDEFESLYPYRKTGKDTEDERRADRDDSAPPISLEEPAEFKVYQRSTEPLPGSDGKLLLTLGDITAGRVTITLLEDSGLPVIARRSIREEDTVDFTLEGYRYTLQLKTLKNLATGRDYATFLFYCDGKKQTDQFTAVFPNGTKINLVGLVKIHGSNMYSWKPNGEVIDIPGILEYEIDGMGTVAVYQTEGRNLSYEPFITKGPDQFKLKSSYKSDSGLYRLLPLDYEDEQKYGALIFKNIKSGQYKKLNTIPITLPELDDNGHAWYEHESLKDYKLIRIELEKLSENTFKIATFFSEHDKPAADSYLALDKSGNYLEQVETKFYVNSQRLTFDFPIENFKALVLVKQDTGTVTFKNISLIPRQMSNVQVETDFHPAKGQPIVESQKERTVQKITLPDVDYGAYMLDLASGELVQPVDMHSAKNLGPQGMMNKIKEFGKGDLFWEHQSLCFVRGAAADKPLKTVEGFLMIYEVPDDLPDTLNVTTAEAKTYEVTVISGDDNEVILEYRPVGQEKPDKAESFEFLQALIDKAQQGSIIDVPAGVYKHPVHIDKPLTLRGPAREKCIFEVTADEPAIYIDTQGKGKVRLENLNIKWQLATSGDHERPFAVAAKDTELEVNRCRFQPLGNFQRCPVALRAMGFTKMMVENCRFEGYEYTVQFMEGTSGAIRDCLVIDSGHQGISLYAGAEVTIERNVVTGSGYHGVRNTGGTMFMTDNLIIENANRGVYIGNKTAHGEIANNIIMNNKLVGISGFASSDVMVCNNLILDSAEVAIGVQNSCRLRVKDNVIMGSPVGIQVFRKGSTAEPHIDIGKNTYWQNSEDTKDCEKAKGSRNQDPNFVNPQQGNFKMQNDQLTRAGQGLTNPEVFTPIWKIWKKRYDPRIPF